MLPDFSEKVVFMAGPCAVEDEESLFRTAEAVKKAGADILRGGAWKPRTKPGEFEGLKEKGLDILYRAGKRFKMPIITEVMSIDTLDLIARYADIIQVGARSMQNFDLLDRLGKIRKPILLKRGMSATIDEFLFAAERIRRGGNNEILLCLRGVRTFDYSQRFPADLYAIPYLLKKTEMPIIFDPSHAAGSREFVPGLARMAITGGANGLLIETHVDPDSAKCDSQQMITPDALRELINFAKKLKSIA